MEWPDNPIAHALQGAYRKGSIERVTIEALWIGPVVLRIRIREATCGDVTCDMVLPSTTTTDGVDLWCEEIAWCTGAPDMCRWVSPERYIQIGTPAYRWWWIPAYRRFQSTFFTKWLAEDATLDGDGERSDTYPIFRPRNLMEAAQVYPASGTGRVLTSVFVFRRPSP